MSLSPSHLPTSPARATKCQKLLKKGRNTFCPSARNAPPNLAKSNKASTNPHYATTNPKKREKGKEKLDVFVSRRKDRNPEKSWPATNE